ncbi:MAG TPA: sugar porter family MFS transporter [Verrucomicrobiae bacterium]|jgi:sugar porter (SP) family MFS transporter
MNLILFRVVVAASLGGFLFGFDLSVISGSTKALTDCFHLSDRGLGLTVSCAIWATAIGALVSGWIAERFGRLFGLRLASWFFVLSGIGCALAWNWGSLVAFRVAGGFAVGLSTVVCPMYIAEISPARLRGRLVLIFQTNIVVGILVAYVSNALLTPLNLGNEEWRWKLGAETLPALVFILALLGLPQSPRWLVKRNRTEEAREALAFVGEPDPMGRVDDILQTFASHPSEPLWQLKYHRPILISFALVFFNNMAGISAVMNYLNDTFQYAGFSKAAGDLGAVIVGGMNFLFTIVAMFLIDRLGRRTLLLIGAIGMIPSLLGMGAIFYLASHQNLLIWCLVSYIMFFAISQGAVIWVYISEIFPNRVRGRGEAVASFLSMVIGAAIALEYPVVRAHSVSFPFFFFSAMMLLQFWVVWRYFPETKGVTLEEIQHKLGITEEIPSAVFLKP